MASVNSLQTVATGCCFSCLIKDCSSWYTLLWTLPLLLLRSVYSLILYVVSMFSSAFGGRASRWSNRSSKILTWTVENRTLASLAIFVISVYLLIVYVFWWISIAIWASGSWTAYVSSIRSILHTWTVENQTCRSTGIISCDNWDSVDASDTIDSTSCIVSRISNVFPIAALVLTLVDCQLVVNDIVSSLLVLWMGLAGLILVAKGLWRDTLVFIWSSVCLCFSSLFGVFIEIVREASFKTMYPLTVNSNTSGHADFRACSLCSTQLVAS